MLISHKYEVLAEIGRGGMGVVYKVRHTSLHTISALKILPAHLAADHELVARFHREARVMAQLRHPNVVRVVDVDKSDDLHYFVMEYVDGCSLSHLITRDGPMSVTATLDVAIQVTRAVAYAHGQHPSVIHRDLKPSNILIEADTGRAVVTDFGLAKLAGGAESLRTESGKFIGTLRYCAPEQLIGAREIDGRVDIYALGMVIYEMIAGRSAYAELERPHVIAGLLQMNLEHPFQFDPRIPEGVRRLILRATAKDRDRRYPTAAALLDDVERLGADEATAAKDPTLQSAPTSRDVESAERTRSRSRARGIAVGTIATVGVAVGSAVFVRHAFFGADGGRNERASPAIPAQGAVRDVAEKPDREVRKFISVMDFSIGSPDPKIDWMRAAIRDNLNSRLSASPDCKVFSKEFIDFKAQQMVREGEYQDVKAATMEVAQRLGVTKAVLGSFRADRDVLHIEAHLVDMETGVQEASEVVEGDQSRFADLQAALAKKLMARLGVTPAAEPEPLQAADSDANLESYRLLLQAEGQGGAAEPAPAPTSAGRRPDRHGRVLQPLRRLDDLARLTVDLFAVDDARAAQNEKAIPTPEDQIRATLERYRQACERKDLALLQEVYQQLSAPQIEANRKYFANARDLTVSFEEIDVAIGGDEAAVSYTRKDNFIDNVTERPTKVQVRLTKIMVRVDGMWKLVAAPGKK